MHSPERTRKSSCTFSAWYFPFGWPGWSDVDADAVFLEGRSGGSTSLHSPAWLARRGQRASARLTTNQPGEPCRNTFLGPLSPCLLGFHAGRLLPEHPLAVAADLEVLDLLVTPAVTTTLRESGV